MDQVTGDKLLIKLYLMLCFYWDEISLRTWNRVLFWWLVFDLSTTQKSTIVFSPVMILIRKCVSWLAILIRSPVCVICIFFSNLKIFLEHWWQKQLFQIILESTFHRYFNYQCCFLNKFSPVTTNKLIVFICHVSWHSLCTSSTLT